MRQRVPLDPMSGAPERADEETQAGVPVPDQSQPARQRKPGRRAPVPDPYNAWLPPWRVRPELRAKVLADAVAAGLSYGAFMRAKFDGGPGPRARRNAPAPEVPLLTKILGELGKLGSNHNQLAREKNTTGEDPELDEWRRIAADIQEMRRELLRALGRAG